MPDVSTMPTQAADAPGTYRPLGPLTVLGAIALGYYLLCVLALQLLSGYDPVAVFWPASGLAAGALVALGPRYRWPIFAAVVLATIVANLNVRANVPLFSVFALCNGAECLLFGWCMQQLDRRGQRLESLASVLAFVVSAVVAAGVAALPAAFALKTIGDVPAGAPFFGIWLTWFSSDLIGIIVVAPMIILLPAMLSRRMRLLPLVEGSVGVVMAAVAAYYAFGFAYGGSLSIMTPTAILFPVFLWLAARAPPVFSVFGTFVVSVVIVMVALAGEGRLGAAGMPIADRLVAAQIALLTVCCAVLTLSAMFARARNVADALRVSEERLQLALSAGRMYAFENDLRSGLVHRAGGLIDRLGLPALGSRDEYLRRLDPVERDAYVNHLANLSPAEPNIERILHVRTKDGEEYTIESRSQAEFDDDGNVVRVRGTCVDITELERARNKVAQQAAELEGALQAGRVFAFEYDDAMRGVRRSDNAAEILGVGLEEARTSGNLIFELVHPEDRKRLKEYAVRTPQEAYKEGRYRINRPDGKVAWLEVRSTAQFDEHGRMNGMRGLARDVTQQERARLRRTMLLSELDHRVKNALARMAVVVDLSREGRQSIDEYAQVIRDRIGSMARTQERLSGNRWRGVGVETLVEDELAAYRRGDNCEISGSQLVLEPDAAQALAFTLHELATNAAKHGALSRPEGRVRVDWKVVEPAEEASEERPVLHLSWREVCDGGIVPPVRESYGLSTIRNLLRYEQGADVRVDFTPTGLHVDIALPLPDASTPRETGPGSVPDLTLMVDAPAPQ